VANHRPRKLSNCYNSFIVCWVKPLQGGLWLFQQGNNALQTKGKKMTEFQTPRQYEQDIQEAKASIKARAESTVAGVTLDLNDAGFLAVLVTQYIAKGNNTDHLQDLVARLTPKAGC
jgi:hypothetical protein